MCGPFSVQITECGLLLEITFTIKGISLRVQISLRSFSLTTLGRVTHHRHDTQMPMSWSRTVAALATYGEWKGPLK